MLSFAPHPTYNNRKCGADFIYSLEALTKP